MIRTNLAPCLQAGSLELRPYAAGDAAALCEAARESVDTVGHWLPWCHAAYAIADAQAWIGHCQSAWRDGSQFAFGIHDEAGLVGGIGINGMDETQRNGNLGYWTRQSRQGDGIASRAARILAAYAFTELRRVRLEIVCAEHNHASRRTAEKLGARFEGLARHRLVLHGTPVTAAVYGLIPDDIETAGEDDA